MISKKNKKRISELMKAIVLVDSPNEAARFFRDLLTEKELIEFGNRWKAARMLSKNVSYVEIEEETGLSSTTVARVSKWLNGKEGGYKKIIQKLHHRNSIQTGRGLS